MAHVGGWFFYLATHAVLGEMLKHGKKIVLTSFAAGIALIVALNIGLRLPGECTLKLRRWCQAPDILASPFGTNAATTWIFFVSATDVSAPKTKTLSAWGRQ